MTNGRVLRWIERALFATGIALSAWCVAVLIEARFHRQLTVTQTAVPVLPGDAGDAFAPALGATARATGALLGRLEAPSVQMSAAVLEGTDDGTLRRGAGHIEDTPFPGQSGNIGIAGHRDTVFRPLRDIKIGDSITLTTAGGTYRYRVSRTLIVGPDDAYVLDPTGKPTLTLVTCYPFEFVGHAPQRFIVQATVEPGEPGR